MGYITEYTLSVEQNEKNIDIEIINEFIKEEKKENRDFMYVFYEDLEYNYSIYGEGKWYDFDEDMEKLSKAFPDVVFRLEGDGEETDDVWVKYYMGGKSQEAKRTVTVEEFNPNKLK